MTCAVVEFRSLSKTQARVILSLEADDQELVDLSQIGHRAGVSRGYARKLAHDLVRKGWLQRVRSGTYLLTPSHRGPEAIPDLDPIRVGSHVVEPYYFGYATAAELHGIFPQASRVYYVVSTARRTLPRLPPLRFQLVRVRPSHFFGTTGIVRRRERIVVSDLERTLLDCLNRPELAGGISGVAQMLSLAKPRLNWTRLSAHLKRFGRRSLTRRVGYLVQRVRPSIPPPERWVRDHLARPGDPYVALDPTAGRDRTGPRDDRWHLIRNVSDAGLFAEGEPA